MNMIYACAQRRDLKKITEEEDFETHDIQIAFQLYIEILVANFGGSLESIEENVFTDEIERILNGALSTVYINRGWKVDDGDVSINFSTESPPEETDDLEALTDDELIQAFTMGAVNREDFFDEFSDREDLGSDE